MIAVGTVFGMWQGAQVFSIMSRPYFAVLPFDVLGSDPLLRALVRRSPGRRVPGAMDGAELAFRAVLGQQVSVAGARTLAGRLVARCGDPLPETLAAEGISVEVIDT